MGGERPPQTIRGTAIPAELRAHAQWVLWRWELRENKWTKSPVNARTGAPAKSTDPATWASYDAATAVANVDGGLGFVLSTSDPFVGVDLDGCRDFATSAITDEARAIVEDFASYPEISPSGTGMRIIVRGKLPPGGRKHGWLEVYDQARYLTITGAHLDGTPTTIEERTAELAVFHARYFPPPTPATDTAAGDRLLETLDVIVSRGGEPIDAALLSGGESVLVSEALSLALALYSAGRSGRRIQTLMRDEVGAALDRERSPAYVRMLRRAAAIGGFKHVLYVSHSEEALELADARLHVQGGKATVE